MIRAFSIVLFLLTVGFFSYYKDTIKIWNHQIFFDFFGDSRFRRSQSSEDRGVTTLDNPATVLQFLDHVEPFLVHHLGSLALGPVTEGTLGVRVIVVVLTFLDLLALRFCQDELVSGGLEVDALAVFIPILINREHGDTGNLGSHRDIDAVNEAEFLSHNCQWISDCCSVDFRFQISLGHQDGRAGDDTLRGFCLDLPVDREGDRHVGLGSYDHLIVSKSFHGLVQLLDDISLEDEEVDHMADLLAIIVVYHISVGKDLAEFFEVDILGHLPEAADGEGDEGDELLLSDLDGEAFRSGLELQDIHHAVEDAAPEVVEHNVDELAVTIIDILPVLLVNLFSDGLNLESEIPGLHGIGVFDLLSFLFLLQRYNKKTTYANLFALFSQKMKSTEINRLQWVSHIAVALSDISGFYPIH